MKEVTNLIVREYNIKKVGCDFMGYKINKVNELTYHHLIIPKRKHGPETVANGCALLPVSHQYLHLIEYYDEKKFAQITSEIIDQKIKGHIDKENLLAIREILLQFEEENKNKKNSKGKRLIQQKYRTGRIEL